jgi:hypothetical protein
MWELLLVVLIVVVAVAYSAWVLMPAAVRLRLARALGERARARRPEGRLAQIAAAIEDRARRSAGACNDCGAAQVARKDERRH